MRLLLRFENKHISAENWHICVKIAVCTLNNGNQIPFGEWITAQFRTVSACSQRSGARNRLYLCLSYRQQPLRCIPSMRRD